MNSENDEKLTDAPTTSNTLESRHDPDSSFSATITDAADQSLAPKLRRGRWKFYLVAVLFVIAAPLLGLKYANREVDTTPVSQPTVTDTTEPGIRKGTLEEALTIARAGLDKMEAELSDYQGRMVKRELVGRTLSPETEMRFKIRTRRTGEIAGAPQQSMGVYLEFKRPDSMKGREVIWVEDQNNGKLVAHDTGLAALIKLSLDPTGFMAMQGNRYPITEIGFKNLVRQLLVRSEWVQQEGGADVTFVESFKVGERDCILIQVRPYATNKENISSDTKLDFTLAEIAMDKELQIPLRYASYGIPAKGQDTPPLLEEYTYFDVELNVGLTEKDFDASNPEYSFP